MTIIMNKLIITLFVIVLLVSILCLKISLVEYFTSVNDKINDVLNKIHDEYSIKLNLEQIKERCQSEYNAVENDERVETLIDTILNSNNLSLTSISDLPDSLLSLQSCVTENNLFDISF